MVTINFKPNIYCPVHLIRFPECKVDKIAVHVEIKNNCLRTRAKCETKLEKFK